MVGYPAEVLGVVAELYLIAIDDKQSPFVLAYPRFVLVAQTLQVVDTHGGFVGASAFLYLRHEGGDGRADINHQVGHLHERHHQVEKVAVVVEVAVGHIPLVVEVRCEDACVLVDSTVLDDVLVRLSNLHHILEAFVEEEHLQVERPATHICIEILQVGIELHTLESGLPAIVLGEHLC